jgi:hypothetical protein
MLRLTLPHALIAQVKAAAVHLQILKQNHEKESCV